MIPWLPDGESKHEDGHVVSREVYVPLGGFLSTLATAKLGWKELTVVVTSIPLDREVVAIVVWVEPIDVIICESLDEEQAAEI